MKMIILMVMLLLTSLAAESVPCSDISSSPYVSTTCSSSASEGKCIVVVENSPYAHCHSFCESRGSTCLDGWDAHGGSCGNIDQTDDIWPQGCSGENCGGDCICMCASSTTGGGTTGGAGEYMSGTCDVLSIDHISGHNGKYFNVNMPCFGMASGETFKSNVEQYRNGVSIWSGAVVVWGSMNGGSVGTAHGRRDSGSAGGQWVVGDTIIGGGVEVTNGDLCYDPVLEKGCSAYIHMDGEETYGTPGGAWTLEACAEAVRKLHGHEQCIGCHFFYEDAGYCNCPTDSCVEDVNENAGGPGQLYAFNRNLNSTCFDCSCPQWVVRTSHILGGLGWGHWLTYHWLCNGLQALGGDMNYHRTRSRVSLLVLTLALTVLQVAGGALMLDHCQPTKPDRDLAICYTTFGCWGFVWTAISIVKFRNHPPAPPAPAPAPAPAAQPAIVEEERVPPWGGPRQAPMQGAGGDFEMVEARVFEIGDGNYPNYPPAGGGRTLTETLSELKRAHDEGLINRGEFEEAKQKVVSQFVGTI